uniref:ANK_REP_REGION domain-containing protein n=1 Tax=Haemonchus contortus TaxID=6289 RepID=A0A7I4YP88_HAECO
MPPPKGNGQRGGWRTSQKQQRELDAKMHQTLRSLMFAAYEREEEERQKAFADAQRIVSGTQIGLANVKDELDDECDLELEPRLDIKPIRRPVPVEPEPQSETDRLDIPDPSLQSRPVTRSTVRQQVVEDDEYVDEIVSDNEELFNAHEEKVKIQGDSMRTDDVAISEPSEAALDVDVEATIEDLKMMSLDDVCTRMAYYVYTSLANGNFKHSPSWYYSMLLTCQQALATHQFPRPHPHFDVERELDKLCDDVEEEFRDENHRNLRKFDKRNTKFTKGGGDEFECLYPVAKEDMLNYPILLTGVSGNVGVFFKLVVQKTHMIDEESCYQDCICYSTSPATRANVLHFAAAHGNAELINSILYPDEERFPNEQIHDHYNRMITRWLRTPIATSFSRLLPFDMAVFYDDLKCAQALLSCTTVDTLRERKSDMASPNSSLPFRPYTESQLSLATYYGNKEIVKVLVDLGLIKRHHYPQAFREAANAGDNEMLLWLWDMCGRDESCLVEQDQKPGKRMSSPLHSAAAAGHLRCVEFLCQSQVLRMTPDAVGDLPIIYALENGHMAIVEYLIEKYPTEVPYTAMKSAINCKRNKLAKQLFHQMLYQKEIIADSKPLTFAVEVGNFHMAEYILKQYSAKGKVSEQPWCNDISDGLRAVLCSSALSPDKKGKFVMAFQLAGFRVSMVNVVKTVSDKAFAAMICNSLRHKVNQP